MQLIKIDGTVEEFEYDGKLETLQKAVGGYIEIVKTVFGQLLVIDEEGKLKNKEPNSKATAIAYISEFDYIAGDALLAEEGEIE